MGIGKLFSTAKVAPYLEYKFKNKAYPGSYSSKDINKSLTALMDWFIQTSE